MGGTFTGGAARGCDGGGGGIVIPESKSCLAEEDKIPSLGESLRPTPLAGEPEMSLAEVGEGGVVKTDGS